MGLVYNCNQLEVMGFMILNYDVASRTGPMMEG